MEHPVSPSSTDLSSIPPEFFQTTFSLSNPDTFYSLFTWLNRDRQEEVNKNHKNSSKQLHDTLSSHLDTVEAEISRQVSSRSDSFFASMTSHDVLQNYLSQTHEAVKSLRAKLANVHSSIVLGPLKVIRLQSTRNRHYQLYKKLQLISAITGTQSTIQLLLSTGDYSGAIDLIRTTQEVISDELHGVVAFRYLPVQLAELERTIDSMLSDEVRECFVREFERPFEQEQQQVVADETKLVGVVLGLLKLHRSVFLDSLEEETVNCVKNLVKTKVIEAVTTSENQKSNSQSVDDQIRQLNSDEWLKLTGEIFSALTCLLDRVHTIQTLLIDLVELTAGKTAAIDQKPPMSPGHLMAVAVEQDNAPMSLRLPETLYLKLKAQFIDCSYSVCENIQQRCVKLFQIRTKQRDKTSVSDFLNFMTQAEAFVVKLAEMMDRPKKQLPAGSPLPAFIHCERARFVQQFHEERRHKLAEILDTEMWKAAVVPADFQRLMDLVEQSNRLTLLPSSPSTESNGSDNVATPTKAIRASGEEFCVAGTSLMLFRLVVEYGDCATRLPSTAADLLNKTVELLKTFNSRTCQLVLGAGAVQLLGIKTITAGHLALAARSLQFVLRILPFVKAHFEAILAGSLPVNRHFDQLQRDYNDHVNEIVAKILNVVDGAVSEQFMAWEAKPPVPSPLVKTVCGQLRRLHDSISGVMPYDDRKALFINVSTCFRQQMQTRLKQLDIKLESNTSACGYVHLISPLLQIVVLIIVFICSLVSQELAFFNEQLRSFNLGIANLSIGEFFKTSTSRH